MELDDLGLGCEILRSGSGGKIELGQRSNIRFRLEDEVWRSGSEGKPIGGIFVIVVLNSNP